MAKIVERFAQRLAKIRKAKGLSQVELAKLTGISNRMIAHYETKVKELPHDKIVLLAQTLEVSIDELMGHTPVKEKNALDRRIVKKAQMLDELPNKDQKAVADFIDALHSRHTSRKAKRNSKSI